MQLRQSTRQILVQWFQCESRLMRQRRHECEPEVADVPILMREAIPQIHKLLLNLVAVLALAVPPFLQIHILPIVNYWKIINVRHKRRDNRLDRNDRLGTR